MATTIKTKKSRNQRGSVTAEFIIIFPTFIFLCFLVVEIALMWSDRHLLHLATFEAARAYSYTAGESADPCADGNATKAAKNAAVRRMAAVSPSPGYMLSGLMQESQYKGALLAVENSLDSTLGANRLGAALKRWILGLPAAYALTDVTCKTNGEMIDVEVRYLRAPKMPFVGGAIWATFVLSEIMKTGIGDYMHFDLDQYYFGVKATSPQLNKFKSDFNTAKNQVKSTVSNAVALGLDLKTMAAQISALPGGNSLGIVLNGAGDKTLETAHAVSTQIDAATAPIDTAVKNVESSLNGVARVMTGAIYFVARPLRLVPLRMKVTLAKRFTERRNEEDWSDGEAFLIGPLGKPGASGSNYDHWNTWAKGMSDDDSDLVPAKKPSGGGFSAASLPAFDSSPGQTSGGNGPLPALPSGGSPFPALPSGGNP